MDSSTRFDTTCPSCNQNFEIDAAAVEGTCPFCQTHLRFLEDAPTAPAAPADAPQLVPASDAAPTFAPAGGTGAVPRISPAAADGWPLTCPVCATSFQAAANETRAACPGCGASLVLDNLYPKGPEAFPVACPGCGHAFEVAAAATTATCPACNSALSLTNAYPGDDLPPPSAPVAPAMETPVPHAPSEPRMEAPPSDSAAAVESPRGRFRRFGKSAPKPTAAAIEPNLPPRAIGAPAEGLPYVLSCPTCNKEFSVGAKEREGNCPHCNAPLAFLTDKEYEALKEAEERKKAFQAKFAARKLDQKKRDEARATEAAERRSRKDAAGPSVLKARLPKLLKPKPKATMEVAPPPAPVAAGSPTSVATEFSTAAGASPPKGVDKRGLARLLGRRPKGTAPAPAEVAPVTVADAPAVDLAAPPAPSPEPVPHASASAKPSLMERMRRGKKAPPPAAPTANVEAAIDFGEVRASAPPPALAAAAAELLGTAEPTKPATKPKKNKSVKASEPATSGPVATNAGAIMGGLDFGSSVEVAAAPAAPTHSKKGFFARFKKEKTTAAPPAIVEDATVEMGGFEMQGGATPPLSVDVDQTPTRSTKPAARKKR